MSHTDLVLEQILEDPWRSIGRIGQRVEPLDLHGQLGVRLNPLARRTLTPRMIATGRDPQRPAQGGDAMCGSVSRYESERFDGAPSVSRANQAAALPRKSFWASAMRLPAL